MTTAIVYKGRDNVTQWQLMEDCENLDGTTVDRVTLNIPDLDVFLDSDGSPSPISINAGGIVSATIGPELEGSPEVSEGFYDAYLSVYTDEATNGIAWATFRLQVSTWPAGE
jgi:hypothetical protein